MRVNFARSAWVLVLVLAIPFAARASGEGTIRSFISSINQLYENLEYELALNRIQLARQVPHETEEEVTLFLYEGIILCEQSKQGPGASAFKSALSVRPDAKLPVQVAPKIERLFESVRTQVKSELAAPVPSATGPDHEEQPSRATHTEAEPVMKAEPTPSARSAPEVALRTEQPTSVQHPEPDCGPPPPPNSSSRDLKALRLWRLASMKHTLCLSGRFQGHVRERWTALKTQMEEATTGQERMRITQNIDQFAREFIHTDPIWKQAVEQRAAEQRAAEQRAAEQQAAERPEAEIAQKKESSDDAKLDTSKCQPVVSADCERLMKLLLQLQEAFLQKNPPSRLPAIRQLVTLGKQIRSARTNEKLEEAARALQVWQQQYVP